MNIRIVAGVADCSGILNSVFESERRVFRESLKSLSNSKTPDYIMILRGQDSLICINK